MSGRVFAASLTAIGLTGALLVVGAGLVSLDGAATPAEAFLSTGPRGLTSVLGVPFLVWALLLPAVDVLTRTRTVAVRILMGVGLTLLVALLTLVFWVAVAIAAAGVAALLVAVAIAYVTLFAICALVALAGTHLLLFRRRPPVSAAIA